ncbi:ATP-binding protein [Desulfatiglans anilini]|uniref:ATP-binding protein n=1 Tax=Desulfatiglans anilini TaxID=90728 RepID=UPI000414D478|nr:ATP-binding protein [Desulfatiglans anilini]
MSDENDKVFSSATEMPERLPGDEAADMEGAGVSDLVLKTLFEGIQEEIMVVDADLVIRDANPSFLRRLRLPKEQVIGRKCYEVASGFCSEQACRTDVCHLERARKSDQRVEIVNRVFDRRRERMREIVRLVYPVRGQGDASRYFVQITRDETARRQLVRRVKASQRKFRIILETATDAILSLDADQRIIHFNDAACRLFGYSRREVLGKEIGLFIPPQQAEDYHELKRFLSAKRPKHLRRPLSLSALRKGGESFPVEMGISYQLIESEPTYTAILRDISEKRQMEKKLLQNERLAAVGQTVAQVAHEIKNPLMIIGGFSRQIRETLSDEKAVRKLDLIFEEIGRLERLVADLGDFTKQYRLVKKPTDINSLLKEVTGVMSALHPPGKFRFVLEGGAEPLTILCDPDKVKQVLLNIVGNGLEAMGEGGTLKLSARRERRGARIEISDTGRGIPEGDLERIFEPFYTTRHKGLGLGLSICFKLVEAHGGDISVFSHSGQGTTFSIFLPGA